MNTRLVFGFYHNLQYKRYLMKIITTIFGANLIYLGYLFKFNIHGFVFRSIEYISYLFCSLQTEDKYIKEYYRVDFIDKKSLPYIDRKLKIFFSCYFLEMIGMNTLFYVNFILFICKDCFNLTVVFLYIGIMYFAIEIGRLPIVMAFVLFYYRIKIFCKMFYEEAINTTTTFDWKEFSKTYVEITKSLKKTDWPIKFMVR